MAEPDHVASDGCAERFAETALLLWFAVVPMATPWVIAAALSDAVKPDTSQALGILLVGVLTVVPFAALALSMRQRDHGQPLVALTATLTIASGYVVLEASMRALLPTDGVPVALGRRYALTAVRTIILAPYCWLSARWAMRATSITDRTMANMLGLGGTQWATVWLGVAAAALLTLPWSLTGALGDSLTSLALTVEVMGLVVPQLLIFWSLTPVLLSSAPRRGRMTAVLTIAVYALSTLGATSLSGEVSGLNQALLAVPLGLVLAEMRARGAKLPALLPLALLYQLVPLLFVDPRDALGGGIPELQHVLSYLLVGVAALTLGLTLWLGRRVAQRRRARREGERTSPPRPALRLVGTLAVLGWGLWVGLYILEGESGFFNDGFLIILEEQADLEELADASPNEARTEAVYEALVEIAEVSQRPIRDQLDELGISYRSYYIINMIRVDGHRWLMGRFAGQPGVAKVILNPNVRPYPRRIPLPYGGDAGPAELQQNLAAVEAQLAWDQGIRGEGIVVGGQDTGYDWEHPALRDQYRGWDGESVDHAYNWHDAWDATAEPFDDEAHGTHTMGTVLGDDGGENRIGVAPRATWIGCRNMRRGLGNPGSYAECMEFLMAPYPADGDPLQDGDVRLAANVINNSWGCPRMEGCLEATLRPAVEALRAAGIMMVVSVGNEGPACATAKTPPANYDAVFSVGATTDDGEAVGFSSRGPANGLIKPDMAAPGYEIRSSIPGGGYANAGGTSMAAPHVTGAVALIWSADGTLLGNIEATEELLCRTAVSTPVWQSCSTVSVPEGIFAAGSVAPVCACGDVTGVPNNVYGCGVLDAGAAVEAALAD